MTRIPFALSALAFTALSSAALADEGMWLPEQIPEIAPEWKERGLEIDPEKLADPLGEPLGAIVSLGFCSASFVSEDGLMLTNHHCVERFLQQNSTAEQNRHRDGFVAPTQAEELSVGPGGQVQVVESIEDVTDQVLARIGRRTKDRRRQDLVEQAKKRLIAACERERNRRCRVATYRGGAEFRLIKSIEIKDVRIVAAPPMSVGQFGGEIDNWMWPRHGADFAVLRAYVAPDGSAAAYAEDNVPYKPLHHLEIDPTGAEHGSFVMAAGVPGRTSRHARAESLRWYAEDYLAKSQHITASMKTILEGWAERDAEAAARVGPSISSLANGLKNREGLLEGLNRGGLIADKQATERALLAQVAEGGDARVLRALDEHLAIRKAQQVDYEQELYVSSMRRGADLLGVARTLVRWAEEREKGSDLERDAGLQDRDRERIEARFERLERAYHAPSDRDILAFALKEYAGAPEGSKIPGLDAWLEAQGGADKALDRLYAADTLTTSASRIEHLDVGLDGLEASDDPWIELALVLAEWERPRRQVKKAREGALLRLGPVWYGALDRWYRSQDKVMYDDANGTLRLTLGTVVGYAPEDGLVAVSQTTAQGFAAKAGEAPFDAPQNLVDAAADAKDHRFVDARLGDVPADFLSSLDSTGGNSGSAVMDGQGRLVGLLFDGNYESIAADWVFLPPVTRSICVDIRWVGFVLEHMEGTERVLAELGLAEE